MRVTKEMVFNIFIDFKEAMGNEDLWLHYCKETRTWLIKESGCIPPFDDERMKARKLYEHLNMIVIALEKYRLDKGMDFNQYLDE